MSARKRREKRRYSAALRIATVYSVFGILWILVSDHLLLPFVTSPEQFARFQSLKGIIYVITTAILGFLLVRGYALRQEATQNRLREREHILRQRLQERDALIREVFHRVKNNLQIILSILNLSSQGIRDEDAADRLRRITQRVHAIALIHDNLLADEELEMIQCDRFIHALVRRFTASHGDYTIPVDDGAAGCRLTLEKSVSWGLIVSEFLSNALEHAFPADRPGTVEVRLRREPGAGGDATGDTLLTSVLDDGIGYVYTERRDTPEAGVGLTLARALAGQIAGQIRVGPRTDGTGGTEATLSVPLERPGGRPLRPPAPQL